MSQDAPTHTDIDTEHETSGIMIGEVINGLIFCQRNAKMKKGGRRTGEMENMICAD